MDYNQPYGGVTNDPYVDGSPTLGIEPSIIPAAAIEFTQREIVNAILDNTFTPSNADLRQLSKSIQLDKVNYAIASGAVNNLVAALTPAITSYQSGLKIYILINNTNTGPVVINVNGLGNKRVVQTTLAELDTHTISAGGIAFIIYDGVQFQLLGIGRIGDPGSAGAVGQTGSQGIQGVQGAQGIQGVQGPAGADASQPAFVPGGVGTYVAAALSSSSYIFNQAPGSIPGFGSIVVLNNGAWNYGDSGWAGFGNAVMSGAGSIGLAGSWMVLGNTAGNTNHLLRRIS
jgi:hypothetical protein